MHHGIYCLHVMMLTLQYALIAALIGRLLSALSPNLQVFKDRPAEQPQQLHGEESASHHMEALAAVPQASQHTSLEVTLGLRWTLTAGQLIPQHCSMLTTLLNMHLLLKSY